jgi:hypothetical protein
MASLPQGSTVPAAFGLLPNKQTITYTHFFRVVESLSEDMFKGKVADFVYFIFKYIRKIVF